jgi:hypothetical protein
MFGQTVRIGCMLTMRYVEIVESQLPIPITRCLGARQDCPRSCIFMGGAKLPHEREVGTLKDAGITVSTSLSDLEKRAVNSLGKPILYVLLDPTTRKGDYRAGIREYADRLVIWINPLAVDFEYSLAHEYGHGLTMANPDFAYLDPDTGNLSTEDRSIAGLASSVVDHPMVHRILNELGYDTLAEARRRTADGLASLNPASATNINRAFARADSRARKFVFVNAEALTAFRSEETSNLENRMRRSFSKEFMDAVDASTAAIEERTAGIISALAAATRLLELIDRGDLANVFVSRERFLERLFAYGSR